MADDILWCDHQIHDWLKRHEHGGGHEKQKMKIVMVPFQTNTEWGKLCTASCGSLGDVKVTRIFIEIDIPGITGKNTFAGWRSDLEKKILSRVVVDLCGAKYSLNDFDRSKLPVRDWSFKFEPTTLNDSDQSRRFKIELASCILPVATDDYHLKTVKVEFLPLENAVVKSSRGSKVLCTSSCLPLTADDISARIYFETEDVVDDWHPHQILQ